MRKIPLNNGKCAIVDDDDYAELCRVKWHVFAGRNTDYARNKPNPKNPEKETLMHRRIMRPPPHLDVDHIDHNGLNNQKANLRLVVNRQNLHNRLRPGTSKHPGVSWNKKHGKWQAEICINYKRTRLGYYEQEEDAAAAYMTIAQNEIVREASYRSDNKGDLIWQLNIVDRNGKRSIAANVGPGSTAIHR